MRIQSRAKINLTLDVLGKRPDTYHALRSIMQSVSLADEVFLEPRSHGIELYVDGDVPKDERNLCYLAAALFFQQEKDLGVLIKLRKQIPIAAGLAGGSGNAAAVLMGLNELYGRPYSPSALQTLGRKLGADVPFCLSGGTKLAEGIGDRLSSIPSISEEVCIVLVTPRLQVATPFVYQNLKKEWFGERYTAVFLHELQQGNYAWGALGNVLEEVTIPLFPLIGQIKKEMLAYGACGVLMSGSGPTVFGVFPEKKHATRYVQEQDRGFGVVVFPRSAGLEKMED